MVEKRIQYKLKNDKKIEIAYCGLFLFDLSHIFAHSDESDFDFDYIFSHKESVEKFDEVFKNNIENSGFRTYDDFNKITHQYTNIKWTEINQEQVNFMMENNIGNC